MEKFRRFHSILRDLKLLLPVEIRLPEYGMLKLEMSFKPWKVMN